MVEPFLLTRAHESGPDVLDIPAVCVINRSTYEQQATGGEIMRHAMKVRHSLRGGVVLAALLSWPPTATAADVHSHDQTHDIHDKLHFGPEVYAVERSTTRSGQQRLRMTLDQGTRFTYVEGREIVLEIGGQELNIAIQDHLVRVGKRRWCSSGDIPCIVHAIRRQLRHLTPGHSAHGFAVVQHTLRSMQFGGPIAQVFHALATMPHRDEDEGNDEPE
jgi:hypothetical protein